MIDFYIAKYWIQEAQSLDAPGHFIYLCLTLYILNKPTFNLMEENKQLSNMSACGLLPEANISHFEHSVTASLFRPSYTYSDIFSVLPHCGA